MKTFALAFAVMLAGGIMLATGSAKSQQIEEVSEDNPVCWYNEAGHRIIPECTP